MKEVVEATCREVPDVDVCEEESTKDNVTKLGLVVKQSKKKIVDVQFENEVNINELQLKLQLAMPLEVHQWREIELKTWMASISTTLEDYGNLLEESMQI